MYEETEAEARLTDQIHQSIEDMMPDWADPSPHRCVACGSPVYREDSDSNYFDVSLPVETAGLMQNSDSLDLPENTYSIKFQFCDDHWEAIKDWMNNPGNVTFTSFDAEHVVPQTRSIRPRTYWGQNKIRMARGLLSGEQEPLSDDPTFSIPERLQATLLVAAVDYEGIEYGPVQAAKKRLVHTLQELGYDAKFLREPFVDVEINLEDREGPLIGTVHTIEIDEKSVHEGPPRPSDTGPERRVSDTLYYGIGRDPLHEHADQKYPDAAYACFYWVQDEEEWLWYPFPADYNSGFDSPYRTNLPVKGPTGWSPALGLDQLSARTIHPEEYEKRVDDNWDQIDSERPLLDRLRDRMMRYLQ